MDKLKKISLSILCVICAAIFAIVVHAVMPSPGAVLDESAFDGRLVQAFGFPVVASLYFIMLYVHILIVIRYFGSRAGIKKHSIGLRYGTAFGLIYLIGMQEVVVSSSPFTTYGIDFIRYQLFMGLGDAIPVLALALIVSHSLKTTAQIPQAKQISRRKNILVVGVIAGLFTIERVIGYVAGYIQSDFTQYPVAVLLWTVIFGITFGCSYILLCPIYETNSDRFAITNNLILSLGINWIWFNSFMGLILKGMIGQMVLRSSIDVIVIYAGVVFVNRLIGADSRA